jgi:hypothetical protein
MPIEGTAMSDGESAGAGGCLFLEPGLPLAFSEGAVVLVGAEGSL